ncbi:hypothetical protein E3N88_28087 [Mikania micrantha]|uniref:Protein kinase domain-containing protein n=1 Tax=Mikania micrantha TaxID=192012 RepID=A0A5N6MZI6_9ASTR|nr:hypothetical protein E3N88_28087 [Mikania micrantha]
MEDTQNQSLQAQQCHKFSISEIQIATHEFDEELVVGRGGFGKVYKGVKGTFGYMDSNYFYTNKLTRKSDVYAFRVVLLEVLCGRPVVDTSLDEEQWGLASWAQDCIREGKLSQIIDISLRGQLKKDCLKEFAGVAVS